jgi:hypothetical protein
MYCIYFLRRMRRIARVPTSNVRPLIAKLGSTSGLLRKANPWAVEHVQNTIPNTASAFFRRFFVTCKSFLAETYQIRNPELPSNKTSVQYDSVCSRRFKFDASYQFLYSAADLQPYQGLYQFGVSEGGTPERTRP